MQEMFDLRVFQIINKSSRSITISSLHRWNLYDNSKYLNCDEKMRRCHSMNFEDYSPDRNYLEKIKIANTEETNLYEGRDSNKRVSVSFGTKEIVWRIRSVVVQNGIIWWEEEALQSNPPNT